MTEEVAKIKANKDGTYIDIVPEKCVSAQKAQYDENGRDLLDAESSQTIKGANTFAAKQTYTGGVAVSGTSAIAGNVNMDSGAIAIGSAVNIENHGKIVADNTANVIKAANHNSVLTSNDVLTAKDINEVNGSANNLLHRSGNENVSGTKTFTSYINGVTSMCSWDKSVINSEVNKYVEMLKIKRVSMGVRQHILIGIVSRQRERGWDLVSLYFNNSVPLSIDMTVRGNSDNMTYALSYDDTYWYVYVLANNGTTGSSCQGLILAFSNGGYWLENETTYDAVDTPAGTTVKILTP